LNQFEYSKKDVLSVIHGYGSTGVGGGIKEAVKKCLNENSMRGIVRMFVDEEDLRSLCYPYTSIWEVTSAGLQTTME